MPNQSLIVITGQTGTGKTSLALKLAEEKDGELINADSRQIYKYLDIITGKDIEKGSIFNDQFSINNFRIGYYVLNGIKIWLYDVVDPKEYFSSHDFKVCAEKVIEDIISRGKIPIIIGGTYLYIKHLFYGFETEKIPPDWDLRKKMNQFSVHKLQQKLKKINSDLFNQLNHSDQNNPQRLIRKIEIEIAKTEILRLQYKSTPGVANYSLKDFIGLRFKSNAQLTNTIKKRVEQRLKKGALDEVRSLIKKEYKRDDPGLKTIGYTQLIDYLEGRKKREEAIEEWILREIQYAKRQYTFMKKDKNIRWQEV